MTTSRIPPWPTASPASPSPPVVVIVLSGSFQAIRQLQPFSSLWDSDYGTILLLKIGAFLVVVGIAAWSRRLVHGRGMGFVRADGPTVAARERGCRASAPGSGVGTMVRDDEPATLPEAHPGSPAACAPSWCSRRSCWR